MNKESKSIMFAFTMILIELFKKIITVVDKYAAPVAFPETS